MIPLGHAVEHAATAANVAPLLDGVVRSVHPIALTALFLVLGSAISQFIDNSVGVLFLGPIALELGVRSGVSPAALLTAVTLGSSLTFMMPVSCRANLLVTGAGGYKTGDFARVGTPFTIVVALALLVMFALKDF